MFRDFAEMNREVNFNEIVGDIVRTVIENGRAMNEGEFDFDLFEVEVEYEASDRGLDDEMVRRVVRAALERVRG